MTPDTLRRPRMTFLIAATAVAASVSCGRSDRTPSPDTVAASDTVAPPPWTGPVDSVPLATVVAYAAGLSYDPMRTPGDSQRLITPTDSGPVAFIQAVFGARGMTTEQMDSGRVIARILTPPGDSFPPYGIYDEVTYLWTDSVPGAGRRTLWIRGVTSGIGAEKTIGHARVLPTDDHASAPGDTTGRARWVLGPDSLTMMGCVYNPPRHRQSPKAFTDPDT